MSKPFISIIMPVYNNEKLLPNAVSSIRRQSFHDWELIIVDDGSTDSTPQVCDSLAAIDCRIRVIHQSNQWVYKSCNNGYAAATGEYALIVNSDDTINPDALKEIHDIAVVDNADLIMFNLSISQCDPDQKVLAGDVYRSGNLLKKPFSINNREEIHRAWPSFLERRLVNHQCVYRENIYKTYAHQDRYFADDVLYNQRIADAVAAVAGTPYLVYNCYMYTSESMNVSARKYYGYEHEMFNEIYTGNRRLLEKWGVADHSGLNIISAERLRQLTLEIRSFSAPQCSLSMDEKLQKILENAAEETVYRCAMNSGRLEEWESRILSGIRELLVKEPLPPDSPYYFVYEFLDGLLRYEKDAEDFQKLHAAVYHTSNPKHIGEIFLRKLEFGRKAEGQNGNNIQG